jgi:hypothetical protein
MQRQQAVEQWVDTALAVAQSAVAPGNPLKCVHMFFTPLLSPAMCMRCSLHTLSFAAFIMGLPPGFGPEDAEDPDPFIFSNIKKGHPDYDDLLEEWRPRLKERFGGWVGHAVALKRLENPRGKGEGEGMGLLRTTPPCRRCG